MSSLSGSGQGRFYIIGNTISYYIKKPPAGCALARIRIISKEYNSRSLCVVAQFRIRYNKVMISVYKKDKITYEMKYVTRRSWYVGFEI